MSHTRLLLLCSCCLLSLASCQGTTPSSEGSSPVASLSYSGEVTFYRNLIAGDKAELGKGEAVDGKLASPVKDPLHPSYVFQYWSYDALGETRADLNQVSSGDIYAIWRLYEAYTPAEKTAAFIDKMVALTPECVSKATGDVVQDYLYYILGQAFETESHFIAERYEEDIVVTRNFYPYDVSKTPQANVDAGNLFLTEQDYYDYESGLFYSLHKVNPDYKGQVLGDNADYRTEARIEEESVPNYLSIGFDAYFLGGLGHLSSLLSSGRKMSESNGLDSTSSQGDIYNISGLNVPGIDPSLPGQSFQFYFTESSQSGDYVFTDYYGTRFDVAYRDGKIVHAQAWTQYDTYIDYELSYRLATTVSIDFTASDGYPSFPGERWDPTDFPLPEDE